MPRPDTKGIRANAIIHKRWLNKRLDKFNYRDDLLRSTNSHFDGKIEKAIVELK